MPAAKDSVYVAQLQYIDCPIFSRNEVIHSLFNLIRQCQINLPTLQYSFCVVANHGVHLYNAVGNPVVLGDVLFNSAGHYWSTPNPNEESQCFGPT